MHFIIIKFIVKKNKRFTNHGLMLTLERIQQLMCTKPKKIISMYDNL